MPTPIGTIGAVDSITVAGRVFTDIDNLILLGAYVQGDGSARVSSFRKQDGGGSYVPSGVNFRVRALRITNLSTNTLNAGGYFYTNNDLGISTTTAPSGQIYFGNSQAVSAIFPTSANQGTVTDILTDFLVPNGKYLGIENNAQTNYLLVQAFGYEEAL